MAQTKQQLEQEKDVLLMKKHAFDQLQNDPAKRKKFYQDEIDKLSLERNLTVKEKIDAQKNTQIVIKSIDQMRDRLEENLAQSAQIKEKM